MSNNYIILAGNYWDGLAPQPLGYAEIVVDDGKIVQIGKTVDRSATAKIIDLTKEFVMPGFIDCHVHLTSSNKILANVIAATDAAFTLAGVDACKKLLHNGFTTVRDAADFSFNSWVVPDLKRAVADGAITGPRIVCGGHMLSAVGGHMDFGGMVNSHVDLQQINVAEGIDSLRRAVHREILRGADWIKFAGSGGFGSPSDGPEDIGYSQDEMSTVVAAARDMDKAVFVHAYGDEAVRRAVVAGVRSVEHANLASKATLALLADQGIYLVPTQYPIVAGIRDIDNDQRWPNPVVRAKGRFYHDRIIECAHNIAASNVKIAFGTDLGTYDFTTNGAVEFSEMVNNGVTPLRALMAATSVAAEMLRLDDSGCIAVGKRADLVAMPGNPFANIAATEMVDFVMKAGVVCRH